MGGGGLWWWEISRVGMTCNQQNQMPSQQGMRNAKRRRRVRQKRKQRSMQVPYELHGSKECTRIEEDECTLRAVSGIGQVGTRFVRQGESTVDDHTGAHASLHQMAPGLHVGTQLYTQRSHLVHISNRFASLPATFITFLHIVSITPAKRFQGILISNFYLTQHAYQYVLLLLKLPSSFRFLSVPWKFCTVSSRLLYMTNITCAIQEVNHQEATFLIFLISHISLKINKVYTQIASRRRQSGQISE